MVLYETTKSTTPPGACVLDPSWTNQYIVSLTPSSYAPIHTADELKLTPLYCRVVNCSFPLEFSTAPISVA